MVCGGEADWARSTGGEDVKDVVGFVLKVGADLYASFVFVGFYWANGLTTKKRDARIFETHADANAALEGIRKANPQIAEGMRVVVRYRRDREAPT